jgi:hypothetical protein
MPASSSGGTAWVFPDGRHARHPRSPSRPVNLVPFRVLRPPRPPRTSASVSSFPTAFGCAYRISPRRWMRSACSQGSQGHDHLDQPRPGVRLPGTDRHTEELRRPVRRGGTGNGPPAGGRQPVPVLQLAAGPREDPAGGSCRDGAVLQAAGGDAGPAGGIEAAPCGSSRP